MKTLNNTRIREARESYDIAGLLKLASDGRIQALLKDAFTDQGYDIIGVKDGSYTQIDDMFVVLTMSGDYTVTLRRWKDSWIKADIEDDYAGMPECSYSFTPEQTWILA